MIHLDAKIWRAARRALEKAIALYIDDPNVAFIDLGFSSQELPQSRLVVRIHQRQTPHRKRNLAAESSNLIESRDLGFVVELYESNFRFHLQQNASEAELQSCQALSGGMPITDESGRIFTLGGKVRDRQTGDEMILSGWHVFASSWMMGKDVLIYHPVSCDGNHTIEIVAEFTRNAINCGLDASVSRLKREKVILNEQRGLGAVTGVALPQLGMRVIKSGAGSGVTCGIITGILGYSLQRYANRQQLVGPFVCIQPENPNQEISAPGDSGAWWLDHSTRRAVALHFAGSDNPKLGLAFSMPEVLEALDIDIVTAMSLSSETDLSPQESPNPKDKGSWQASATEVLKAVSSGFARLATSLRQRMTYDLLQAAGLLLFAMALIGFDRHVTTARRQQDRQIAQLKTDLGYFKVIAQVDSLRQQQMGRIVAVIDRFNPEMHAELKYNLAAEIYAMSLKYPRLDVALICATITHETGRTWNPEVISHAGALGLMQIIPSTGIVLAKQEGIAWTSAEEILFNPLYNVRLGCRYLDMLVTDYGLEAGLAGYNGGDRQAKRWLRGGRTDSLLPRETAYYVPAVLKIYREYRNARQ